MPVPRASPATTAAGARSALPAAGRAATGYVQCGLPRRSAPSGLWRDLYRRGVPRIRGRLSASNAKVAAEQHRREPELCSGAFAPARSAALLTSVGVGLQRDGRLLIVRSGGRDRSNLPGGKLEDREPGTRAHPRGPRRTGPRPHPSAQSAHCAGAGPRPNRRHSTGLPRPHVSNAGQLQ